MAAGRGGYQRKTDPCDQTAVDRTAVETSAIIDPQIREEGSGSAALFLAVPMTLSESGALRGG
jgi:hypothetical protein